MKTNKKLLTVLTALVIISTFSSCSKKKDDSQSSGIAELAKQLTVQNQRNVFSLSGVMSPIVGVVVGDKIQFYQIEDNEWTILPDTDMKLK